MEPFCCNRTGLSFSNKNRNFIRTTVKFRFFRKARSLFKAFQCGFGLVSKFYFCLNLGDCKRLFISRYKYFLENWEKRGALG